MGPLLKGVFVCVLSLVAGSAAIDEIDQKFVVVLGDSITLGAAFPLTVCDLPIVNAGVSGARTSTLLPILDSVSVSFKPPPALLIIAIGVNDSAFAYWNKHTFEISYSALLTKAASITRVVVATVAPIDTSMEVGKTRDAAARDTINKIIISTAGKLGATVIRLDNLLTEQPLTIDGVHLTEEANLLWLSQILNAIVSDLGC